MPDEYDGIILGTGHNSLVLQAYMARSGLRVLAVDRSPAPGGGLATIENPRAPGFRHNTHSFFHRALTSMPWYRDLELERHGARYIEPELNVALILSEGRSLEWWTNFEKTAESLGEFSKRDAATLRRWVEEFRPIVERILIPEAQSPPLPPEQRRELLGRSRLGRRLLEKLSAPPLADAATTATAKLNDALLREIAQRAAGFDNAQTREEARDGCSRRGSR